MRNDNKKEQPRKERNRHQTSKVSYSKKMQQDALPETTHSPGGSPGNEKEIKGKDIDLMNYTDI